VDIGPVSFVYYSMCAAPGAAAGLLVGLSSRRGVGTTLAATIVGVIGGMTGGYLIATVPTPPPGTGNDGLIISAILLFTAFCGGALSYMAARLLRRRGA
jgi:hypothetical protein